MSRTLTLYRDDLKKRLRKEAYRLRGRFVPNVPSAALYAAATRIQELEAQVERLRTQNRRLRNIAIPLADPMWSPDELISDGPGTALDYVRHQARQALGDSNG